MTKSALAAAVDLRGKAAASASVKVNTLGRARMCGMSRSSLRRAPQCVSQSDLRSARPPTIERRSTMNKLKRTLVAGLILAGAIALGVVAPNMIILPAVAAVAAMFLMATIVLSSPPTVHR
jgi:hypothetical protein